MNTQLNSINFQQFVSENKGKLISFKHTDKKVSKVVQDVCGEYFTAKANESDAKIDGFYYFSDCKMIEKSHPLIDVLKNHKICVLLGSKFPMQDVIFEYVSNSDEIIYGKKVSSGGENVSYAINFIDEAWAVVNGKYTQVWKRSSQTILSDEQKINNIKTYMKELLQIYTYSNYFSHSIDKKQFLDVLKEIHNHTYSKELYSKFVTIWEDVLKQNLMNCFSKNKSNPYLQALIKRFAEICKLLNPNCDISFLNKFNFMQSSYTVYNEIVNTDVSNEFESLQIKKENKHDCLNTVETPSIKIEYRGKPKSVQVINEYTHTNGKKYVTIKDLSDSNTTKTLFKEYIKYL